MTLISFDHRTVLSDAEDEVLNRPEKVRFRHRIAELSYYQLLLPLILSINEDAFY